MTVRRSRALERVHGEVVEGVPVARPVERREPVGPVGVPVVNNYYVQAPEPVVDVGWPTWKRLVGWGVTIVGTAAAIIALLGPPHISQSHRPSPDLVHPSR